MKTVKTIWSVDESGKQVDRQFTITYHAKGDNFMCRVPHYLSARCSISKSSEASSVQLHEGIIYGNTPGEIVKAVEKLSEEYSKACEKTTKVIVYDIDVKDIWHETNSLKFRYAVCFEVALADGVSLYEVRASYEHQGIKYPERKGPRYSGDAKNTIPWTPEAEVFFRSIDEGLNTLKERLTGFLGDKEKLVMLISSGAKAIEYKGDK